MRRDVTEGQRRGQRLAQGLSVSSTATATSTATEALFGNGGGGQNERGRHPLWAGTHST